MKEREKEGERRILPPLRGKERERERPWTREDFERDLRKATRRPSDEEKGA